MFLDGIYTKCFITGEGKILDKNITNKNFTVHDLSAAGADVFVEGDIDLNEIYEAQIYFNTSFIGRTLNTKVRFEKRSGDTKDSHYYARFIGISEQKKIEIDELLKTSCAIKEISTLEPCAHGNCIYGHLGRRMR